MVQLIFVKRCCEKISFRNHVAQQIFPDHRTIQYIFQLLKTNLLSETIYCQTQSAFICLNSAIITVE